MADLSWKGALNNAFLNLDIGRFNAVLQNIEISGFDGVERLNMGERKRTITVRGIILGRTDTGNIQSDIDKFDTGKEDTLTIGTLSFPNVRPVNVKVGNIRKHRPAIAGTGETSAEIELTFEQLHK